MAVSFDKISTIVRNLMPLYALRLLFLAGGRLWPEATLARAAKLFCTPFRSSRQRALAASSAGAREERIDVDGLGIATYVWGDPSRQPYVLFAHGWSSHGTRIAPWAEPLRAAGYALVAFDQAGHGKSDGRRTTLPDFACHLLAVGRHYGPAAAVIGHSLGGAATAVALARGLAAERAILIAPAADPLAAMERFSRFVWLGAHWGARLAALFERQTRVPIEDLQAHRNAPLIGRPALVVHDLEDREVPWSEGERYARLWNGARMITTRGFGHNRIADHPQTIGDALRFLHGETVGARIVSSPNLPFGIC
jgi:pimeloyl-ACP methyl ester carboxylesterase